MNPTPLATPRATAKSAQKIEIPMRRRFALLSIEVVIPASMGSSVNSIRLMPGHVPGTAL